MLFTERLNDIAGPGQCRTCALAIANERKLPCGKSYVLVCVRSADCTAQISVTDEDAFTDYRGDLYTVWKDDDFDLNFNHDKVSTSRKHVLRGIHGDNKSWKLVTCLYGDIYFVMVDNRESSDTFMRWKSMTLNDRNKNHQHQDRQLQ